MFINKCWKPSLLEFSSAFAYFCTNLSDIQEDIDKRQSKYSQYGATIQPYIIFVEKYLSYIDSSYTRDSGKAIAETRNTSLSLNTNVLIVSTLVTMSTKNKVN
ncbi:hypothetical protein QTP88_008083 [Uroleucon formosanum]